MSHWSVAGQSLPVVCHRARGEVRFCSRTGLIPILNLGLMLVCSVAEPRRMAIPDQVTKGPASAVEQGKADEGEATASTQTRLADPD